MVNGATAFSMVLPVCDWLRQTDLTLARVAYPGYFMNHLLRLRIWAFFLASSGHAPCDVLLSTPRVRVPAVTRLHAHLNGLVTPIHEISGLWDKVHNRSITGADTCFDGGKQ